MNEFFKKVIEHFTPASQLNIAIEEMAELTKEICKYKRGFDNRENIIEEMADVFIMLRQTKLIFEITDAELHQAEKEKIKRLKEYMQEETQHENIFY